MKSGGCWRSSTQPSQSPCAAGSAGKVGPVLMTGGRAFTAISFLATVLWPVSPTRERKCRLLRPAGSVAAIHIDTGHTLAAAAHTLCSDRLDAAGTAAQSRGLLQSPPRTVQVLAPAAVRRPPAARADVRHWCSTGRRPDTPHSWRCLFQSHLPAAISFCTTHTRRTRPCFVQWSTRPTSGSLV